MNFIVTSEAMRPASPDSRQCFYYQQPINQPHKQTCVLIKKKVLVRMTVEYEIEVPASWNKQMIEFFRNEGSWCSDNALNELENLSEDKGCLCSVMEFECLVETGNSYLDEA